MAARMSQVVAALAMRWRAPGPGPAWWPSGGTRPHAAPTPSAHRCRIPDRVAVPGLRQRYSERSLEPHAAQRVRNGRLRREGQVTRGIPVRHRKRGRAVSERAARPGRFAASRKIEPQEFTSSGSTVSRPSGRMPCEKPAFAGSHMTVRIACRSVSAAVAQRLQSSTVAASDSACQASRLCSVDAQGRRSAGCVELPQLVPHPP